MLGLSLYCRDFGLEADKCSVCPVTEELEVLKKLMAGLQDIKLIGKMRGEGGGSWSQLWCFNSEHLWERIKSGKQMDQQFVYHGENAKVETNCFRK